MRKDFLFVFGWLVARSWFFGQKDVTYHSLALCVTLSGLFFTNRFFLVLFQSLAALFHPLVYFHNVEKIQYWLIIFNFHVRFIYLKNIYTFAAPFQRIIIITKNCSRNSSSWLMNFYFANDSFVVFCVYSLSSLLLLLLLHCLTQRASEVFLSSGLILFLRNVISLWGFCNVLLINVVV